MKLYRKKKKTNNNYHNVRPEGVSHRGNVYVKLNFLLLFRTTVNRQTY